jgi:cyclopropane fatty-acyl-phospholipid synthase-like methyltransferase
MDPADVKAHWQDWAARYGTDLQATTRAATVKRLEVDALARALRAAPPRRLLEAGCGNGANAVALARAFPELEVLGVDYVEEMVAHARVNAEAVGVAGRVRFEHGDVLELAAVPGLAPGYDAVVSVRCLINLSGAERQEAGLAALTACVAPGGLLLLIENSVDTHAAQNDAREALGLARRAPAAFNTFLADDWLRARLGATLTDVRVEDFASLHDLVLYALVPATNGGEVDYDHPLVAVATRLSLALGGAPCGAFGQNRLWTGRRAR